MAKPVVFQHNTWKLQPILGRFKLLSEMTPRDDQTAIYIAHGDVQINVEKSWESLGLNDHLKYVQ